MEIKYTLLISLLLLFLITATVNCRKQDAAGIIPQYKKGAVKGKVFNEYNQLLTGAVMTIQGNGMHTSVTTTDGYYIISALQPGPYDLSVKKEGYVEESTEIQIKPEDTTYTNFVLKAGTAYLNLVSDSVITVRPSGTTFWVKVLSNASWVLNNAPDWMIPTKRSGNGDDSLEIRVAASPSDTVRQAQLVVQAGSVIKNVLVRQLPEVSIKKTIALPGNTTKGISDSFALQFNQPVTIKYIVPGYDFCQSDIAYSYTGDNKVTFSYGCGAIGGDYPFTITVLNRLGDEFTQTITVGFYERAIHLTGTIKNYFVNDADNTYWILTDHPNALYKIDMNSFEILHRYDLPNEPVMFTINPYNNKIYLSYLHIPKLYVMNQSGATEQVIDIKHDTTRTEYERDGPRIFPVKLAFTKNGKGMVWLSDSHAYSYTGFWFIDAAAGHRIWYEALPGEAINYLEAKANYDKTKLILTYMGDGDPTIGTFDSEQMKFSSYKPTKITRGIFIAPSRKNADVYSGQLYNQLIVNPTTGYESLESYKDNRNYGNVDFSYKPGQDKTIYFTEEARIEVLDYSNRTSPVIYDAIYFLQGTTTTLDGKHVIVNRHDGNYNAKVIQLPGSWFEY